MANEVKLTFAGDSDQLEKAFSRVGEASRGMADEVGKASKRTSEEVQGAAASLDRFGEAADTVDTRAMGFRDTLTGVQDSMAGTAAIAKGDLLDGILLVGMGVGDLGSGIFNFLVPQLKSMIANMNLAKIAMGGLAFGVVGAAVGLALWSSQSRKASTDIRALTEDLERFSRTGKSTEILRRNFGEGATAVDQFSEKLQTADGKTASLFKRAVEATTLIAVFRQLTEGTNAFSEAAGATAAFEELDTALAGLVDQGADADKVFHQLTTTYGLSRDQVDQLRAQLPKYTEAAKRAEERTGELAEAQTEAARATFAHIQSIKDLADQLKAQTDPVFAFVQAQKAVRDAQANVNETAKEFGAGSQQWRDAILDLAKAQLDLVDATSDAQGATDASLIPALKRLQADGHLSKESLDAVTNAINSTKAAADRLDNTRMRLRIDLLTRGQIPFGAGHLPGFHTGGIVPGAPGTEVVARLQAGERVQTQAQQQSQGRGLGADDLRMMSGSGLDRVFLQWLEGLLRANNLQLVRS